MFLPFAKQEKVGKNWFQLRVDVRLESNSLETHPLSAPDAAEKRRIDTDTDPFLPRGLSYFGAQKFLLE